MIRKNLDLSAEAVKALTIQAIKENTVFKLYAQKILEDAAKPFIEAEKKTKIKKYV